MFGKFLLLGFRSSAEEYIELHNSFNLMIVFNNELFSFITK